MARFVDILPKMSQKAQYQLALAAKHRTLEEYQQREKEIEANRYQPAYVPKVEIERDTRGFTEGQLSLFATSPESFDLVEKWLERLPRKRQREHFRKIYVREYKSVKDDGTVAFACGNKQRRHANRFLYDLLHRRLNLVMKQYDFNVSWLELKGSELEAMAFEQEVSRALAASNKTQTFSTDNEQYKVINSQYILKKQQQKAKLPFYLIAESKLEEFAQTLANLITRQQVDFVTQYAEKKEHYSTQEINQIMKKLYIKCGKSCLSIGFPIRFWDKSVQKLKAEQIDIALAEIACEKYWFRRMRKAQIRMVEHIAIACGSVQKNLSPYVSFEAFNQWKIQVKKNYDFLRAMIVENVNDVSEQAELFDMYLKSNSNPALRRMELMTRLNGLEEWADVNEYHALFLTLTAPSSFHAQLHHGGQNPKWQGSSPRETHNYLNRVWQQFRALLAKRKIKMFGMRCAEPHHDGTPHWHILIYVKQQDMDEVERLFKLKALELDGDEKGAKEHRAKVERADKSKGSPTAYIAKYIAKNVDGFANDNQMSDEVDNLSMKDNAKRARAWATLWGIRQFQFLGDNSVGVWRELRRLIYQDVEKLDKKIQDMWICADHGSYASVLDLQGGAGAKREDKTLVLHYEDAGKNYYGLARKKIVGLRILFNSVCDFIKTRKKQWTIKRRPTDLNKSTNDERSEANNGELARPWTCVSNCNRSQIEQIIEKQLMTLLGTVRKEQVARILNGNDLILSKNKKITLFNNQLLISNYKSTQHQTGNLERLRGAVRQYDGKIKEENNQ